MSERNDTRNHSVHDITWNPDSSADSGVSFAYSHFKQLLPVNYHEQSSCKLAMEHGRSSPVPSDDEHTRSRRSSGVSVHFYTHYIQEEPEFSDEEGHLSELDRSDTELDQDSNRPTSAPVDIPMRNNSFERHGSRGRIQREGSHDPGGNDFSNEAVSGSFGSYGSPSENLMISRHRSDSFGKMMEKAFQGSRLAIFREMKNNEIKRIRATSECLNEQANKPLQPRGRSQSVPILRPATDAEKFVGRQLGKLGDEFKSKFRT